MVQSLLTKRDDFGEWLIVGSVTPEFYTWSPLGNFHEVSSGFYRLIFECSDFSLLNSSAWIRAIYKKGGTSLVSQSSRIYPKAESLALNLEIPQIFSAVGVTLQAFEIMKVWQKTNRWGGIQEDKLWSVQIEQLTAPVQTTKNTIFIVLDEVSYTEDPQNPGFYLSTFTEKLPYAEYEVGRLYSVANEAVLADPFIDKQPYQLKCVFTGKNQSSLIPPGTVKVRIIY